MFFKKISASLFLEAPTDTIYIRVDYTIKILCIEPNFCKLSLDGLPDKTDSIQKNREQCKVYIFGF